MKTDEKYLALLEKCTILLIKIYSTICDIHENLSLCLDILEKHDDDDITLDNLDK